MKKFLLVLSVFLTIFTSFGKANTFLSKIYGTQPKENSIAIGSIVYHFLQPRKKLFYPYLTATFKNSLTVNLFQNSYEKFGGGIGIHRDWYKHDFKDGSGVRLGYMLGIIYGYCFKMELKCHKGDKFPQNMKLIPGVMLFGQYFFNKHVGVSISWAGSIIKLDFVGLIA